MLQVGRSQIRMLIVLALVLIIPTLFLYSRREKLIGGFVLDCSTNKPIENAEVSVNQRGWGFDNGPVWDKDYTTSSKSDTSGHFEIRFRVGSSVHLMVKKAGYFTAEQYEYPKDGVEIKMLQGEGKNFNDITYNCKKSSECLSCKMGGNVEVCKNTCI